MHGARGSQRWADSRGGAMTTRPAGLLGHGKPKEKAKIWHCELSKHDPHTSAAIQRTTQPSLKHTDRQTVCELHGR